MIMPIYMDHHSTTPVAPEVLDAMLPYFTAHFGNAASRTHPFGWRAAEAVDAARQQVAALAGAEPKDVIFTSGATESINLALKGAARELRKKGAHIITTAVEHSAVLDTCRSLEHEGFDVTYLPVRGDATLDLEQFRSAIRPTTILVSMLHANNEVGTINPVAQIGAELKTQAILFHIDASQSFGRIPVDMRSMEIDLLSVSAHKLYGPKGVGALLVRRKSPRTRLAPLLHGGGHERGWRSGTLNVPGIVGLGAACQLASTQMEKDAVAMSALRDTLLSGLRSNLPDIAVNGTMDDRLPNNLNVSFVGVEGESLIMALRDVVAVSSGSACTSAKQEPSHVLSAMGVTREMVHSSIRFGLGRGNTMEQVETVISAVTDAVRKLRELAPSSDY